MDNQLHIEYIPISDLRPYEKNARKHDKASVDAIANSIREFGFDDPVGIWGDNFIVEGHGRVQAAKKLGMKEVPCIRLDHLTDDQRRAYGLAHNKTAEVSDWDSVHGKAIYFGDNFSIASSYAQSGTNVRNPIVMRAKITGGRTISESRARSNYQSALRRGDKLALACSNAGHDSAVNLYALAKGYDAIEGGYTMVLNRRCLTISDQTRKASGRSSW